MSWLDRLPHRRRRAALQRLRESAVAAESTVAAARDLLRRHGFNVA